MHYLHIKTNNNGGGNKNLYIAVQTLCAYFRMGV